MTPEPTKCCENCLGTHGEYKGMCINKNCPCHSAKPQPAPKEMIEEIVKETAEHFEWFVTLTNAQKTATREIVRSALTRAFQLGVEASEKCVPKEAKPTLYDSMGFQVNDQSIGFNACRSKTLQAIANLKEPRSPHGIT